mmetsp:Transcript_9968/g.24528  ORF Transcript_9968/g.24528 Transcript_9968/m.24528 type:complete len:218 (-) Transcript_9968:245-898(-)
MRWRRGPVLDVGRCQPYQAPQEAFYRLGPDEGECGAVDAGLPIRVQQVHQERLGRHLCAADDHETGYRLPDNSCPGLDGDVLLLCPLLLHVDVVAVPVRCERHHRPDEPQVRGPQPEAFWNPRPHTIGQLHGGGGREPKGLHPGFMKGAQLLRPWPLHLAAEDLLRQVVKKVASGAGAWPGRGLQEPAEEEQRDLERLAPQPRSLFQAREQRFKDEP